MHDAERAVPNYFDVSVGLAFIGLMTWGAVEALKGRTSKILFGTSLALLIVSINLVPTTVGPDRVSPAELTRAGAAVLSLIVSLTIIVLLGTAREPQPVRRVGWGWTVAGGIAIVLALALLGEIFEALGPSVSLFLAVQLLILGALMILVRVWRGATLSIVILAGLFGIAEITVAIFGTFVISRCGYDGASAFTIWRSQSRCPAAIGARDLEKWAIVAAVGLSLIVCAAYGLRSVLRNRRATP